MEDNENQVDIYKDDKLKVKYSNFENDIKKSSLSNLWKDICENNDLQKFNLKIKILIFLEKEKNNIENYKLTEYEKDFLEGLNGVSYMLIYRQFKLPIGW